MTPGLRHTEFISVGGLFSCANEWFGPSGANPLLFYAVLLWQPFLERCDFYLSKGVVAAEARAQAGLDVLKRQATRTIIPRFAETFIREVWEMQTRLLQPKPQQIEALSGHARFRAGFDFLLLPKPI